MTFLRTLLVGAAAFCLLGCGSSSTGAFGTPTCGGVEPCGGDLTGNWAFTGECVNSAVLQPDAKAICATASIGAINASASGSVSFNSDMSYSISETVNAVVPWNIPSSCLSGLTCTSFASSLQAQLGSGETFTCTGSSVCACSQTVLVNTVDTGTYSTAGTSLVLSSASGGTAMTGTYCVKGSTLHLITVDTTMNTGPMGQATIDKDVTAQRQ